MKDLLSNLKSFYTEWETDTLQDRVIETIAKIWATVLVLIFIIGFSTIVVETIINPSIWENVQFGIYDTLGT